MVKNKPVKTKIEQLVENLQGGVISCSVIAETKSLRVNYMSEGWTKLTGYSFEDLKDLYNLNPQGIILPNDRELCQNIYLQQISNGNNKYHLQYRFTHKDGSIHWALDHGIVTDDEHGNPENQSILTDITSFKTREDLLRTSEERFRLSMLSSNTAIYEFDTVNLIYTYFENTENALGVDSETVRTLFNESVRAKTKLDADAAYRKITHPDDLKAIFDSNSILMSTGSCELEIRFLSVNKYIWCKLYKKLIRDENGNPVKIVGSVVNIDENKMREEALALKTQIEPSTGLFNKPAAKRKINDLILNNNGKLSAMLLIDIDDFKSINDTLGHTYGDMVLVEVATKLKNTFINGEIVARIGGDEFLVFIPNVQSVKEAMQAAESICNIFRLTYNSKEEILKTSCSVGLACDINSHYITMVEHADMAMYEAKQFGKDRYALYDSAKTYNYTHNANKAELHATNKSTAEMIFDLLYGTTNFAGSVDMVLSFICNSFNFNYAYIYENVTGSCIAINTFEWANDSDPIIYPKLPSINYENNPNFFDYFDNHKYRYNNDLAFLSEALKLELELNNVKSILHIPLMRGKQISGLVGFGKPDPNDELLPDDITKLLYATKILGTFIFKQRAEDEISKVSNNKAHAMDNLPVYVYVTDIDRNILFMNKLVFDAKLNASVGDKCYEKFMGLTSICSHCPAITCGDGTASCKITNSIGMPLISTAQKINWDGQDAFMVTCQDISLYI